METIDSKSQVFAVYDSKAGFYKTPFIMRSKGEALRGFTDVVNDEKTEIGRHPGDFTLFHLGSFDDENGKYLNNETPVSLGVAVEFVNKELEVNEKT